MGYSEIKQLPISNKSRKLLTNLKGIAVHYAAGDASLEGLKNWYDGGAALAGYSNGQINSHYGIDCQGRVAQYVPENEESWCTNSLNSTTISIEVCNKLDSEGKPYWTAQSYDSLVQLCAEICSRHSINPLSPIDPSGYYLSGIVRHYDATRTTTPIHKVCPPMFIPKSKGGLDDETNSAFLSFRQEVANRMSGVSGINSGTILGEGYIYHPFGEAGLELNDGAAAPHLSSYNRDKYGLLSYKCGSGREIYSQLAGEIVAVTKTNGRNPIQKGYEVILKTNNFGYKDPIYIHYSELGGLADFIISELNNKIPSGKATFSEDETEWIEWTSISILKGKLIGYSNAFNGESNFTIGYAIKNPLDTDFTYTEQKNTPLLTKSDILNEDYNFSLDNGILSLNSKIIGNQSGRVPLDKKDGPDSIITTYPNYSYCILLQTPSKFQDDRSYLTSDQYTYTGFTPGTEYGEKYLSNSYMGQYPTSLEQLNSTSCKGIRILSLAAQGEFGQNIYGLTYGKLFRTWIMYDTGSWGGITASKSKNLNEFGEMWRKAVIAWTSYHGATDYGMKKAKNQSDLYFAQVLYENIRTPHLNLSDALKQVFSEHGYETEYNEHCRFAAFSGPCQNASKANLATGVEGDINDYGPFDWIVNEDILPDGKGGKGNTKSGNGCYLLYRVTGYSFNPLNPNV